MKKGIKTARRFRVSDRQKVRKSKQDFDAI